MENRFGLKDLAHLLLLCLLIVVVLLAMKQYDRQWQVLDAIQKQGKDELRELVAIRKALASGVPVAARPGSGGAVTTATSRPGWAGDGVDPFRRLKEAQQLPGYATGDWMIDNLTSNVAKLTPLLS